MVNKVMLIGNLGQDPQVRNTQSGTVVANFSLATSRRWNDRNGNRQEQTEWHRIVCFARLAEIAGEYLAKGRQVYVEGRLQTQSWKDQQTGETRYKTEIVCESLQMLGQRTHGGESAAEDGTEAPEPAEAEAPEPAEGEEPPKPAPAVKKPAARKPAAKKKPRRQPAKKSS